MDDKLLMEEVYKKKLENMNQDLTMCGVHEMLGGLYPYMHKVGIFFIETLKQIYPDKTTEEIDEIYKQKLEESQEIITKIGKLMAENDISLAQILMISTSLNFSVVKQLATICSKERKDTGYKTYDCAFCYQDCEDLAKEAKGNDPTD